MSDKTNLKDSVEVYKIYKGYLEFEHNLISQRTTWLVTIQAFLIAAYALSSKPMYDLWMGKILGTMNADGIEKLIISYRLYLFMVSLFGCLTSAVAMISIWAASRAKKLAVKDWERVSPTLDNIIPHISGAGSKLASKLGDSFSNLIPWIMFFLWVGIAFTLMFDKVPLLIDALIPVLG